MSQTITADIDGDGTEETLVFDGARTVVSRQGTTLWDHTGWIDGWNRRASDRFQSACLNGNGHQNLVAVNAPDLWTGVLYWNGTALRLAWSAPPPQLQGPAGAWLRRYDDQFLTVDLDGDGADELLVTNATDRWTGVLRWIGNALQPVWMSPGPLRNGTSAWNRRPGDTFHVDTVDHHVVDVSGPDNYHGILAWESGAIEPIAIWEGPPPALGGLIASDTVDTGFTVKFDAAPTAVVTDLFLGIGAAGSVDQVIAVPVDSTQHDFSGLASGTTYHVDAWYKTIDGWTSETAGIDVRTTGAPPVQPPPTGFPMPSLIGLTLVGAKTVLAQDQLTLGYVDNPALGADDKVTVTVQNPAPGAMVHPGESVNLAVVLTTLSGFQAIEVLNQNSDGRAVDVYLVDDNTPNLASHQGAIDAGSSLVVQLPTAYHRFQVIAIDTGLIGCPGDQPFNSPCQRGVSQPVLCVRPGLLFPWSVV